MIRIISDTHGMHSQITYESCDMLIHCGDAANEKLAALNQHEFYKFWDWFLEYPAKYKVFVPGNHDSWIESPMSKTFRKEVLAAEQETNIYILIDRMISLMGYNIYGSPWTPTYGDWSFMRSREKIHKVWEQIPEHTDILVTHGPPKGILDLTYDYNNKLVNVGDNSLMTHVKRVAPLVHCFGHIHDHPKIKNQGCLFRDGVLHINASCVTDGQFSTGLSSTGIWLTNELDIIKW